MCCETADDIKILVLMNETGGYGLSFAVNKGSPGFRREYGTFFEYRHDEVVEILKTIIDELGLKPEFQWDRGMGNFVYELWLQEGGRV